MPKLSNSRLRQIAVCIEKSPWYRFIRIFEVLVIIIAVITFFLDAGNRATDRAAQIGSVFLQIADSMETDGGRKAAHAAVQALANENVDMSGIFLRGAELREIQLSGARLSRANFQGAILIDANFSGAILTGADFRCFDAQKMSQCADLHGADFTNTQLRHVRFQGAKRVDEADWKGACYNAVPPEFSDDADYTPPNIPPCK